MPQVTKIFLKLREMGIDVPADVYTIPYAVKKILEAKARREVQGRASLCPAAMRKGAVTSDSRYYHWTALPGQQPGSPV